MATFQNLNVGGRDMRTAYNFPSNSTISSVPNSTPALTPNFNGKISPFQTNHFVNPDIQQIPPNVRNDMIDFNLFCGSSCPLPDNNSFFVDNPLHNSSMCNCYISLQQQHQQQKRVYELPGFPGYKVELIFTPINNQSMGPDGQILSSQSEIPGANRKSFLNNSRSNNSMSSYLPDNNYGQQSSIATTSPQNCQNCYNPSQQHHQTNIFDSPAFIGYNNPQNNCNSVNNFNVLYDGGSHQ
ncbi:hypothetical protein RhiirA5_484056 [Rhizophagus irregularis]|uniref:Uncharacterized protein n=1 Tax=Rhizophagus irregularis TaxID=588596 RepID=A0A2I1F156_9GLOM|nr:hypothetical protein RhiirA5_484056 [Rhizophagus irregularis]PKY28104.1 hypothetical protein RhiirB3_390799 [Rhizophagus irregularis]CAB5201440.1 unnamed protein product [Rhizophagus irregularis]CAB5374768.1 unnamed protein product [Rhizophagus irregularis]